MLPAQFLGSRYKTQRNPKLPNGNVKMGGLSADSIHLSVVACNLVLTIL
jgi:hypothetical protein